ncbi:MAG TPA: ABC transporter ATP-binding protein [Thermomicrobiales bacterium]|nr:ABC transporter ATP-binding protein [Thermomicrobiales bacterium]
MSNGQPAIRFEQVTTIYRGASEPAVRDITLSVMPGELVVLLGPSGCGKTTLLKMVNRLIEPSAGRIYLNGTPIDQVDAPELRRGIGYVIQQTGLFPHMRVADNVAVVPRLLGWDKRRTSARIDELLELVGLPPEQFRRRYPAQLSGGQQQRVGLARALAGDPEMILMDEPFGALDAITRSRLQDELLEIHQRLRKTVLFVTHDIEEAVKLADRIVVMNAGRIEQYDTPLEIILNPANAFVARLVGAGDVLRRLSLIRVETIAQPLNGTAVDGLPVVLIGSDARAALNLLLAGDDDAVVVQDDDGQPLGLVDLDVIQAVSGETGRLQA